MSKMATQPRLTYYLLTGDVGGTNSRMRLYKLDEDVSLRPMQVAKKDYENQKEIHGNENAVFEDNIIAPFLKFCWEEHEHEFVPIEQAKIVACLAIAGPVQNNAMTMSNLKDITVDGTAIEQSKDREDANMYLKRIERCMIINDFVVQGYGCLTLEQKEFKDLVPNSHDLAEHNFKQDPPGPKVCIGAGTGLGECYLVHNGEEYVCFLSEGGHVEFNP